MAYTQDFFTSRRNYGDGTTRIGEVGRLWYDPITNTIRVSDGVTPGGIIVTGGGGGGGTTTIVSGTAPGVQPTGTLWWNTTDGNLYVSYQGTWVDASAQYVLAAATTSTLGGVKIGAGITVAPDGTISVTGVSGNGYTGSQGATGYIGSAGIDGINGYTGSAGIDGINGYTGSAGVDGINGYTGSAGVDGINGYVGSTGYTGSSSAAIVSDTNPGTEATGTFWWNTIDGNLYINYQNTWVDAVAQYVLSTATTSTLGGVKIGSGISITADGTISVTGGAGNGYTGSAGINGINGYTGSAGIDGVAGYIGSAGINGYIGSAGIDGISGYTGSIGYTGSSSAAIVSDTNPGPESTGTFWWNTIDGNLYINYQKDRKSVV